MFKLTQQAYSLAPESKPILVATDRTNPFVIPNGERVIISVSGGRTSGYLLKNVIDASGGQLTQ